MRKIFVNGVTSVIRTLSPYSYKDSIKSLDKSNEARVTLDGNRVFRSAVTKGVDVKSGNGGYKFHLYYYFTKEAAEARDTSRREFLVITSEEYRAYKEDPGFTFVLETVDPVAILTKVEETGKDEVLFETVDEPPSETEVLLDTVEPETEVLPEPEAGNGSTTRKSRRK